MRSRSASATSGAQPRRRERSNSRSAGVRTRARSSAGSKCGDRAAAQQRRNDLAARRFGQIARIARCRRPASLRARATGSRGHAPSRSSRPKARCTRSERQRVAADLLHQRRHGRAQMFEQRLQLLPAEQLARVRARRSRRGASRATEIGSKTKRPGVDARARVRPARSTRPAARRPVRVRSCRPRRARTASSATASTRSELEAALRRRGGRARECA